MSKIIRNNSAIGQGSTIYFGDPVEHTITANTNNVAIVDLVTTSIVHIQSTGNFSITGLVPPDIYLGWWILIYNTGTNNITLKNNDAGSIAQNRFLFGSDKVIQTDEGIALVYDVDDLRWRSFGINI